MDQRITITDSALDLVELNHQTQSNQGESGASVIFTGAVRVSSEELGLVGMTLEHYAGMTESLLTEILNQAENRWQLTNIRVAHRVGYLTPGEPIVFVGTSALHRKEAFQGAEFIMDYLKNKATFWKKEHYKIHDDVGNTGIQEVWVKDKQSDAESMKRWENE